MHFLEMIMSSSDLKVSVMGEKVNAHKFVLAARSDVWSLASMASTSELDLTGEHPWLHPWWMYIHLLSVSVSCSQLI